MPRFFCFCRQKYRGKNKFAALYFLPSRLYGRCRNHTCSALASERSRTIPPVRIHTVPRKKAERVRFAARGTPKPLRGRAQIFYSVNSKQINYSSISVTTPDPTVLPPSRIAKRRPFSIAIGVISSTLITTLSPGRHISTSSGRLITPVTSVVLK